MHEEDTVRCEDMLAAIAEIYQWTENFDEQDFVSDRLVRAGVAMQLVVIGETAKRLTAEAKAMAGNIEWAQIVSLRNRIAHGYPSLNHPIIWGIVNKELPMLEAALQAMLQAP